MCTWTRPRTYWIMHIILTFSLSLPGIEDLHIDTCCDDILTFWGNGGIMLVLAFYVCLLRFITVANRYRVRNNCDDQSKECFTVPDCTSLYRKVETCKALFVTWAIWADMSLRGRKLTDNAYCLTFRCRPDHHLDPCRNFVFFAFLCHGLFHKIGGHSGAIFVIAIHYSGLLTTVVRRCKLKINCNKQCKVTFPDQLVTFLDRRIEVYKGWSR